MGIKLEGNALNALRFLEKKSADMTPAVKKSTAYMERITRVRFLKETAPDGSAWADLKPSTLSRKKTRSKLRETLALLNSVSSEVNGNTGRVFATTEYGIYHQTGTSTMPQRQFLGFSEAVDVPKIATIFFEHYGF